MTKEPQNRLRSEKAISYYEKAALQGIPQAESNLGHLLLNMEKESEKVSLETAEWLKKRMLSGDIDGVIAYLEYKLAVSPRPAPATKARERSSAKQSAISITTKNDFAL